MLERVHAAQVAMLVTTLCAGAGRTVRRAAPTEAALKTGNERLQDSNERLQLALGGAELGAFSMDLATGRLDCDARVAFMHGHSALPTTIKEGRRFVHPDDLARIDAAFAEVKAPAAPGKRNTGWCTRPATRTPVRCTGWHSKARSCAVPRARPVRLLGVARDITEHKHAEERLRSRSRWNGACWPRFLPASPLADVLGDLARAVEQRSDVEMMVAIPILDKQGKHLLHGAAPSLPQAYNDAIHGAPIGPAAGPCGTAAFRGETVVVADIAEDPLWADYRDLATAHGLRACWSTPVKAADGRVLGTFAIYYRRAARPHPTGPEFDRSHCPHRSAGDRAAFVGTGAARKPGPVEPALDAAGWSEHGTGAFRRTPPIATHSSAPCAPSMRTWARRALPCRSISRPCTPTMWSVCRRRSSGRWRREKETFPGLSLGSEGRKRALGRIARGRCLYDPQGTPLRFPGAVVDVSECRQAEFALKESEARLQQALTAGQVMAFEWDARTGLSQRSRNTVQILGIARGARRQQAGQ